MNLLTNSAALNHSDYIKGLFKGSQEVYIAVAFLKESGLNEIMAELRAYVIGGGACSIICGLDFGLTEPGALLAVRGLSEKNPLLKLYTHVTPDKRIVFHPKCFMAIRQEEVEVIIGSANLTSGGLRNNNECSFQVKVEKATPFFTDMHLYFTNLLVEAKECSLLSIFQYKTFYDEQKKARKGTKAKPDRNAVQFNYLNLLEWLKAYRNENDVNKMFRDKTRQYKEALIVLDAIADTPNLAKHQFIPLLEKLVGSRTEDRLWHSGSIFRKKTTVFNHPRQFQRLVQFIREHLDDTPSIVFDGAKQIVEGIEGSGVNTVTEIMMTYNPGRFANLNKNPIKVLGEEANVHIKSSRNSFNGYDYALYCDLVAEISRKLGLRNMLEADSFFNDIYWQIK